MNMVEIDKKLYQDIKDYCKVNNLVIKDFVNKLLRKAFTVEKYGEKPFANNPFIVETEPSNIEYCTSTVTIVTPTEVESNINEVGDKQYWGILDDELIKEEKVEEPKVEKKSKKRKLN